MKIVGNYRFQKVANSSLILNLLMREGDASRSHIAEAVGLRPSTVTYIVQRLIDAGLLTERGAAPETGGRGRRGVSVGINGDFGRVIGCDLQADYYTAVITDITGRVLSRHIREYRGRSGHFEELLLRVLTEIGGDVGPETPIVGAGVAIPGIVNPRGAVIEECWTHGVANQGYSGFLKDAFSHSVILENDANACAWKKLWYESGGDSDAFIYLLPRFHKQELLPPGIPSVGIGMGLVYNGEIYRGVSNRAGEFLSTAWKPDEHLPGQLGMSVEEMARVSTDRDARRTLIAEILRTLAQFIHMTDPRSLYIGGDLAGEQSLVDEVLATELPWFRRELVHMGAEVTVLERAVYDPAEGAAAQMLHRLYSVPRLGGSTESAIAWQDTLAMIGDAPAETE